MITNGKKACKLFSLLGGRKTLRKPRGYRRSRFGNHRVYIFRLINSGAYGEKKAGGVIEGIAADRVDNAGTDEAGAGDEDIG